MRVLVCGGRNFRDRASLWTELDAIWRAARYDTMIVIQGGAAGADQLAREWCCERYVPYDNFVADWQKHGRAAGPIRNQRMIDEGEPDLVVAFPGNRGTADMCRRARAAGIKIVRPGDGA